MGFNGTLSCPSSEEYFCERTYTESTNSSVWPSFEDISPRSAESGDLLTITGLFTDVLYVIS